MHRQICWFREWDFGTREWRERRPVRVELIRLSCFCSRNPRVTRTYLRWVAEFFENSEYHWRRRMQVPLWSKGCAIRLERKISLLHARTSSLCSGRAKYYRDDRGYSGVNSKRGGQPERCTEYISRRERGDWWLRLVDMIGMSGYAKASLQRGFTGQNSQAVRPACR